MYMCKQLCIVSCIMPVVFTIMCTCKQPCFPSCNMPVVFTIMSMCKQLCFHPVLCQLYSQLCACVNSFVLYFIRWYMLHVITKLTNCRLMSILKWIYRINWPILYIYACLSCFAYLWWYKQVISHYLTSYFLLWGPFIPIHWHVYKVFLMCTNTNQLPNKLFPYCCSPFYILRKNLYGGAVSENKTLNKSQDPL